MWSGPVNQIGRKTTIRAMRWMTRPKKNLAPVEGRGQVSGLWPKWIVRGVAIELGAAGQTAGSQGVDLVFEVIDLVVGCTGDDQCGDRGGDHDEGNGIELIDDRFDVLTSDDRIGRSDQDGLVAGLRRSRRSVPDTINGTCRVGIELVETGGDIGHGEVASVAGQSASDFPVSLPEHDQHAVT